jgi:hypothetical protein
MAKRRRTDNTMVKRRRTDNTMAKRRRTDNTMAKRRTGINLAINFSCKYVVYILILYSTDNTFLNTKYIP